RWCVLGAVPFPPKKTNPPVTSITAVKPAASTHDFALARGGACLIQTTSRGAMIRSLTISPSHQVNATGPNCSHVAAPLAHKLVTPQAALTDVLRTAAKATNRKIACARPTPLTAVAYRFTTQAPQTASAVFPSPMKQRLR